ncbi:MAG: hypothetical protein Q8J97_07765 [Flavobacteriaceae bacterium]|nr:hypothetical protein [Flavobacteriaceae bacterium]
MKTLKDIKKSMVVSDDFRTVAVDGKEIYLQQGLLKNAIIEGLYRQLSQETAGTDSLEKRVEIFSRWNEGYLKESDRPKAATTTATKKATFAPEPQLLKARALKLATKKEKETLQNIELEKLGVVLGVVLEKMPQHPLAKAYNELKTEHEESIAAKEKAAQNEILALLGLALDETYGNTTDIE